ncbi:MAG: HPr family phosphocarrier protein [Butyricicoccus pullicaecorum]|nr:HPr family phosphocarrier protein [Butyricicoccus pullicaecorum]
MKKLEHQIADPIGIHARPAERLAQVAGAFQSKIVIAAYGDETEAIYPLSVLGMNIRHGDVVTVTIEGQDEVQAAQAIADVLKESL